MKIWVVFIGISLISKRRKWTLSAKSQMTRINRSTGDTEETKAKSPTTTKGLWAVMVSSWVRATISKPITRCNPSNVTQPLRLSTQINLTRNYYDYQCQAHSTQMRGRIPAQKRAVASSFSNLQADLTIRPSSSLWCLNSAVMGGILIT